MRRLTPRHSVADVPTLAAARLADLERFSFGSPAAERWADALAQMGVPDRFLIACYPGDRIVQQDGADERWRRLYDASARVWQELSRGASIESVVRRERHFFGSFDFHAASTPPKRPAVRPWLHSRGWTLL